MAFNTGRLLLTYLFLFAQFIAVFAIEDGTGTEKDPTRPDSPYESQIAQCTIKSGDIEASAEASISKTLVGVCGTDEMLTAFRTLEAKLLAEIDNLRKMIRNPSFDPPALEPSTYKTIKNVQPKAALPGIQKTPMTISVTSVPPIPKTSTVPSASITFPDDDYDEEADTDGIIDTNQGSTIRNSDLVKNLPSTVFRNASFNTRISSDDQKLPQSIAFKPIDQPVEKKFLTGGLRDYEVYRFNNTVISSGDAKVFKYFWKIEHFTKRVRSAPDISKATFSSAVFVISGLNLRLHASIASKSYGDVLYVQLEQLSSSDDALRKTPNVILLSGKTYGQVQTGTFFRHKIVILNQDEPFSDLISSDLTNTNAKFEAPLSSLTTESYLKDDKLLIKIIIFL
uniref:Uncharacterized protein n=1 Tax=Anopheles atroparvus TaxID=41427 RepID=A0AAG5D154_ANOAO